MDSPCQDFWGFACDFRVSCNLLLSGSELRQHTWTRYYPMVWAYNLVHLVSQVIFSLSNRLTGVPLWVITASSVAAYVLMTFSTDDLSYHSRSLDPVGKLWWNISGLGYSYLDHPPIFRMASVYMWVVLALSADSHVLRLCLVSGRQKIVPVIIVCCLLVSEVPLT